MCRSLMRYALLLWAAVFASGCWGMVRDEVAPMRNSPKYHVPIYIWAIGSAKPVEEPIIDAELVYDAGGHRLVIRGRDLRLGTVRWSTDGPGFDPIPEKGVMQWRAGRKKFELGAYPVPELQEQEVEIAKLIKDPKSFDGTIYIQWTGKSWVVTPLTQEEERERSRQGKTYYPDPVDG